MPWDDLAGNRVVYDPSERAVTDWDDQLSCAGNRPMGIFHVG